MITEYITAQEKEWLLEIKIINQFIQSFMKKTTDNSRRSFLRNAATIAAGISIVPRHVLGRGFLAPSDQLTKGIIGVGGMGRGHIPYAGTRVVAICDVDQKHLSEVANSIGGGVKTFHDHRELIALPEVDIVHPDRPQDYKRPPAAQALTHYTARQALS